jgi:TRAP-type C4-dicarboxylate transport system permease small subunit
VPHPVMLCTPMKKSLEHLCGALAGVALFAIMALTFFDVLGRKLASNSIPGSLEVTEMLMVVVIFAALPLVSQRGEHVAFDSLDAYMPAWARRAQSALMNIVCGVVLILLAALMWKTGNDFTVTGETSAQLHIAKAPFIYGMAIASALTGLVHLVLVARPAPQPGEGEGVAL